MATEGSWCQAAAEAPRGAAGSFPWESLLLLKKMVHLQQKEKTYTSNENLQADEGGGVERGAHQ
jgi:hypothetical protein